MKRITISISSGNKVAVDPAEEFGHKSQMMLLGWANIDAGYARLLAQELLALAEECDKANGTETFAPLPNGSYFVHNGELVHVARDTKAASEWTINEHIGGSITGHGAKANLIIMDDPSKP